MVTVAVVVPEKAARVPDQASRNRDTSVLAAAVPRRVTSSSLAAAINFARGVSSRPAR